MQLDSNDRRSSALSLSPTQLAQRWVFHVESIRRILRERRLPAFRVGGRLRVQLTDVEAFEASHRVGGPAINTTGGAQ
jgi:excisionase family DNA binding protein